MTNAENQPEGSTVTDETIIFLERFIKRWWRLDEGMRPESTTFPTRVQLLDELSKYIAEAIAAPIRFILSPAPLSTGNPQDSYVVEAYEGPVRARKRGKALPKGAAAAVRRIEGSNWPVKTYLEGPQPLLKCFGADALLLFSQSFVDKTYYVGFGHKRTGDTDLDSYLSAPKRFAELILELQAVALRTQDTEEAFQDFLDARCEADMSALRRACERILKDERARLELRNHLIMEQIHLRGTIDQRRHLKRQAERHLKRQAEPILHGRELDDILVEYIRTTLHIEWSARTVPGRDTPCKHPLRRFFPACNLANGATRESLDSGKLQLRFRERPDTLVNISVGADCVRTLSELCNVYRFLQGTISAHCASRESDCPQPAERNAVDSDAQTYESMVATLAQYLSER